MRKLLVYCLTTFFISCGTNDDHLERECGGVIDYFNAGLFKIELVDALGTNLIQDGTYNPDHITASINGDARSGVFKNFDASLSRDTIRLYTLGSDGENRWLLHLSETDTDTLDFSLSSIADSYLDAGILFCGMPQILNSASYNGKSIALTSTTGAITIGNVRVLK